LLRFAYELQQPQLAGETVERGLYIAYLRSLKKWQAPGLTTNACAKCQSISPRGCRRHAAKGEWFDGVIWTISFVNGVNFEASHTFTCHTAASNGLKRWRGAQT
jgi:hypothetical protein